MSIPRWNSRWMIARERLVKRALHVCGDKVQPAAKWLGISRTSLQHIIASNRWAERRAAQQFNKTTSVICENCRCAMKPDARGSKRFCGQACRRVAWGKKFSIRTGRSYESLRNKTQKPDEAKHSGRGFKLAGGVSKIRCGKLDYYQANIQRHSDRRMKHFSVAKLGETGARLAASFQRMAWLIELGFWKPDGGDPMSILSYQDSFRGNAEYENSHVVDVDSPCFTKYDRDDK